VIPVLYIVDNLREGGSQRYVAELTRFGSRFGIEPHVCSFEAGGHFFDEIRSGNYPLIVLPVSKVQNFSTINVIRKLLVYVWQHKIKVIHTFQTKANIIGTAVGRLTQTKVITSRRDIGDYALRGSRKLELFEKIIINRLADKIMVNSRAVLNAVLLKENVPHDKIELVYNTVDLERFNPGRSRDAARIKLGLDSETIAFGTVAGFRPVKGVDVLIRSAGILSKLRKNFKVFIAGDGPEYQKLVKLVSLEGVEDHIVFLGHLNAIEDMHPAFDVFVLSSRSEGCSNALLEAQASGLPVIATRVGGNPEIVLDGKTGILVPSDDPASLAQEMDSLASGPEKRLRFGQNARRFIESQFSQNTIHAKLSEMYRKLINQRDSL
jgi:glycosyltransferase involved in cell wall biosynthesis